MYFLLLLALVASVSAGTCPEGVTPVDNFNFASFARGTWYEVARYPNVFEEGYECGSATYSKKDAVFHVQYSFVKNHEHIIEHGIVKIADKNSNLGVVTQSLPLGAYKSYQHYPLNILAIEYEKYFIGYYCQDGGKGLGWIYSREKTLSAYSKGEVDKFLKKSQVLQAENFIWPQFTPMACRIDSLRSLRLLNTTNA